MIYVLRLFEVDAAERTAFTSAFDYGGLWQEIAGTIPGYLFTHLLRHENSHRTYLAIEFWDTEEHFAHSRKSLQVLALRRWIQFSTRAHFSLGAFCFTSYDGTTASGQNAGVAIRDHHNEEHQ